MKAALAAVALLAALSAAGASRAHSLQPAAEQVRWTGALERQVNGALEYPPAVAVRRSLTADVAFVVGEDGAIGGAAVARSSGVPELDAAALAAVLAQPRVAPPPPGLAGRPVTFRAVFQRHPGRPLR